MGNKNINIREKLNSIDKKKVDLILNLITEGEKYKASKAYRNIAVVAFFITVVCEVVDNKSMTSDKIILNITAFFGVYLFLAIFYSLLNEIRKSFSIKSILALADNIIHGRCDLGRFRVTQNLRDLHPLIMCHPVTMYLFGQIFLKGGYPEEGKCLINKAKIKNAGIDNVALNGDQISKIVALRNSLLYESKLQPNRLLLKVWKIRPIRYALIISLILVLLIHYLSLILRLR